MESTFTALSKAVHTLLDLTDVPDDSDDDGDSEEDAYLPRGRTPDSDPEGNSGGPRLDMGNTSDSDSDFEDERSTEDADHGDIIDDDEAVDQVLEVGQDAGPGLADNPFDVTDQDIPEQEAEIESLGYSDVLMERTVLQISTVPVLERERDRVQAQIVALVAVQTNIENLIKRRKAREARLPGLAWAVRHRDAFRLAAHGPKTPNDLPAKLLGRIFVFAWKGHCLHGIAFSHVCSHWRSVALATPDLWNSIDLTRKVQLTKLHVERSGESRLDMRVISSWGARDIRYSKRRKQRVSEALHVIRGREALCCTLTVVTDQKRWLTYIFGLLHKAGWGSEGAEIDALDIVCLSDLQGESRDLPSSPLKVHPRSLRFSEIGPWNDTYLFSERLQWLYVHKASGLSCSKLVQALSYAPNVERLQVLGSYCLAEGEEGEGEYSAEDVGEEITSLSPVITLRRLEELELEPSTRSTEWFIGLMEGLELPSLRRASLFRPWHFEALSMKYPALEELVLRWWDTDEAVWTAVLARLPSLRILRISSCDVSSSELTCLRASPISHAGNVVCPRLHTLDFHGIFTIESSFLVDVVTSRRDMPDVSPIRSLIVRGCDSVHMDYDAVLALGGQGVTEVVVECLDVSWAQQSDLEEEVSVFGSDSEDEA